MRTNAQAKETKEQKWKKKRKKRSHVEAKET